jgi:hypothetical protein
MTTRKTISTVALAGMLMISIAAQREVAAQRPDASIRNFRAVDLSSDTLKVTVDYIYRGELPPGGVRLHATPQEAGGIFDPRTVLFDELPVRPGAFTTTLTIAKRAGARDFTSVAVRVCLSTSGSAIVCQDFPHAKRWTSAGPTPAPDPQTPESPDPAPEDPAPSTPRDPAPSTPPSRPVPQMCSISGVVQGRLVKNLGPDHPGGVSESIELRHIVATKPDGTTIRATIANRRFVFRNLPAGAVYKLSPGPIFRSNPGGIAVRCKAGVRHSANFRIL